MVALLPIVLREPVAANDLERLRRNHHDALAELQKTPAATARIIRDVALVDGVVTTVPHGMGRAVFVTHSPPRGAVASGRIDEIRDNSIDRTKYVGLRAIGYASTITVDIEVK